jgi:hypothetical protein
VQKLTLLPLLTFHQKTLRQTALLKSKHISGIRIKADAGLFYWGR